MQHLHLDICRELVKYLNLCERGRMKCVSKFWNTLIDPAQGESIHQILRRKRLVRLRKHNPLLKLIQCDKRLNWTWRHLTANPNVTPQLVALTRSSPWDNHLLAVHPNFTYDDLLIVKNKIDWKYISENPNITISMVLSLGLDKEHFSTNPALTMEIVERYPDFPWVWLHMHKLYCDNIKLVLKYIDKRLSWAAISMNMPMQDIIDNPQLPWSWPLVGHRQDITLELIQKLPAEARESVSSTFWRYNENITFRDIEQTPVELRRSIDEIELRQRIKLLTIEDVKLYRHKFREVFHFWENASKSPLITFQDIYDNQDLPWCRDTRGPRCQVSENPNITIDIVLKHLDFGWSWIHLSQHPNITFKDILANPSLPWEWFWVTANPNVTLDDMLDYYPRMRGHTFASDKNTCNDLWIK